MERIAKLPPVALRPFSRIRSTVSFSSSCDGDVVGEPFEAVLVPVKGGQGDVEKVFPFLGELLETRVHVPSVDLGLSKEAYRVCCCSALADDFRTFLLKPDIFELTLSAV